MGHTRAPRRALGAHPGLARLWTDEGVAPVAPPEWAPGLPEHGPEAGDRDQVSVATLEVAPESVHVLVVLEPIEEQQVDRGAVDPGDVLPVAQDHRHLGRGDESREPGLLDLDRRAAPEVDHPVREPIAHEAGELLDVDRGFVDDQLPGFSVAREVEDAVAALVLELVEVVLELVFGIAGQVAEPDLVDPRRELEEGDDAQAALDVAVPERFQAGDVLLVALRPAHLFNVGGSRAAPPRHPPPVLPGGLTPAPVPPHRPPSDRGWAAAFSSSSPTPPPTPPS